MSAGNPAGGEGTPHRKKAVEKMSEVYGWEMADGPGLHFAHTADQLFGEVWTLPDLTNRDRRLLLLGLLAGNGHTDVAEIQAGAALGNGELTPEQLEEIAVFLCYYAGWPVGTKMNTVFGTAIKNWRKSQKD
ncbi:carboxymuconolactone decarboxylase family protein [Gordonia sp. (in: high G+C Gram-positive bacteria)]|uniref:carboxymuconolactone decarboxylase family protein n=1 Tax=Gordonia sp. (in: high G+C Gram-positive bacteria) TaxID=84139 RepID=UPI0039E5948C